jgi:hypothetical protein
MPVFYHPFFSWMMSFTTAYVMSKDIREHFPALRLFVNGTQKCCCCFKKCLTWTQFVKFYFVFTAISTTSMNFPGALWASMEYPFIFGVLWLFSLGSKNAFQDHGLEVITLGKCGMVVCSVYLVLLYVSTYFILGYDLLPSIGVQIAQFYFYGIAILGIMMTKEQPIKKEEPGDFDEEKYIKQWKVLTLTIVISSYILGTISHIFIPLLIGFAVTMYFWTAIGLGIAAVAMYASLK